MEELRDASIHHTAIKLFGDIKCMKLYDNLFQTVQVFLFCEAILFNFIKINWPRLQYEHRN